MLAIKVHDHERILGKAKNILAETYQRTMAFLLLSIDILFSNGVLLPYCLLSKTPIFYFDLLKKISTNVHLFLFLYDKEL